MRRGRNIFLCFLILGMTAAISIYLWHQYSATVSGDIDVCFQGGTLSLTWKPELEMDACRLFRYDGRTRKYIFCGEYTGETIIMDQVIRDEITLRLQAVSYARFWGHRIPLLGFSRKLTVTPRRLSDIELNVSADPENGTVHITWNKDVESAYEVYLSDPFGKWQLYATTGESSVLLDFNNEFALPDRDAPVKVAVRGIYHEKDYTLYSPMSNMAVIERADLLEDQLCLEWEQVGERQYVLNWKECRGEWYEVQQWSSSDACWVTKGVYNWTDEMSYTTGRLPSYRQVRFRVISYNETGGRDMGQFAAEPSEVTFHTDMSALYCTIWPITSLKIIDSPQAGNSLGEVPAGQALCVLEECGGYFKILYRDCPGYIDARFCMINLPEYIGDLCEYNISNSICSIFTVHGYHIPEITGSVVRGYENICIGPEDYVVPYLYPCTKKLCVAASRAAEDGYRFRIYDAFRPNEATRYLYHTVESLMDMPVEEEDAGMPEDGTVVTGEQDVEEVYSTLGGIMTDGRYKLSSFLAASVSAHNSGIALDLVLVDQDTDGELPMQSAMHDLSWYSSLPQNNANARLLAQYMKGAGYNDLFSEWWHFQDDEIKEEIGSRLYLRSGVSVEGWKRDDAGWRYRMADGSYYVDTTERIEGKEYTFDADGYLCSRDME